MKKGIALLAVLLIPIFSIIPLANSTPTIHVYYSRYDSVYSVSALPAFRVLSANATEYIVTSTAYNSTVTGNNQALHATYNKTVYILTFGNVKTYTGEIKVTAYVNNTITVYTQIPNLIRVIVESVNESELVWAGVGSSNMTINALAYINGSGKVILEFANGTKISNVTLSVKLNSTVTAEESLSLEEITGIQIKATEGGQISIQTQIPRRYAPLIFNVYYNGSSWTNASGYEVTVAYFNGTLTPALVWKGLGVIGVQGAFGAKINISAETIEFYGKNGTVLGYVHIATVEGSTSNIMMLSKHKVDIFFSEIKIVTVEGVKPIHSQYVGKAFVNGQEVIIEANSRGEAESTAYVNFTHVVNVNGKTGVLVQISLNSTSKFVAVTSDNETVNVTTVKPENVTNATVQIQGKAYVAQKVVVNTSAKYILFNVSILVNNSAVTVYKEVNGQLVQLNSSNYFVNNGKVVVFDDPSTVYYVVYQNETVQTQTSTSTSTTTTTSAPSQTTSQATTSQALVTSTTTATPTQIISSSAQTSSSSNSLLYIGIAIAVVLIVVGIIIALRRK